MARRVLAVVVLSGLVLLVVTTSAPAAVPVYVADAASSSVSVFKVGSGGALSPVTCSGCATGTTPYELAVDPTGRYVYVPNYYSNSVSAFRVGAGGALSPVTCSACATGSNPYGVAVDPSGRHVYVTNFGSNSVSVFEIRSDGALSPVTCSTGCVTGSGPYGVAVDPSGRYVYVANGSSNSVSVFKVGSGGALSPVTCSGCGTGGPYAVAVDPSGRYVYVTSGSDSVSVFKVGKGGALSPVTCTTGCATGTSPAGVAVDPTGRYVYVANAGSSSVSAFEIRSGGALSPVSCSGCAKGSDPYGIAVDPSGRYVYVANYGSSSVSVFKIRSGGALSPVGCSACNTGAGANWVAVSPDRGPTAAFSLTPAPAGAQIRFDASGSKSSEYPILTYAWSFGDGHSVRTSSPTITHAYAKPGTYTVRLTVTDKAGCSTKLIYAGQTAYCDGSDKAVSSHKVTIPPTPVVFAGYADGFRNGKVSAPSPWRGSPGVIFKGCNYFHPDRCPETSTSADRYDAGAIRIDNTTGQTLTVSKASVVIGSCTLDPWPGLKVTLPPGQQLILTQTGGSAPCHLGSGRLNFDTSETNHSCTHNNHRTPALNVSLDGAAATFTDRSQILNTGGVDQGAKACGSPNETHPWGKMTPPT